jgi:hypothetical protein
VDAPLHIEAVGFDFPQDYAIREILQRHPKKADHVPHIMG